MDGLGKIIGIINEDSAAECDGILNAARAECERVKLESERQAAGLTSEIISGAETECRAIADDAERRGQSDGKKKLMNARHRLVTDVITQAVDRLKSLPDAEYVDVLSVLLSRYVHSQEGEILLSSADEKRLTPEFRAGLEQRSLKIIIDDEISGGFVMRYGQTEENCTFSALLADKRDVIRDKVYGILFG